MPPIHGCLYKETDNVVEFTDALDVINGLPVNTATMRVWLYTQSGVPVPGATWPISGNYIAESDGRYYAIIQDGISWTADTIYKMVVEVDGGPNHKRTMVRYMELVE